MQWFSELSPAYIRGCIHVLATGPVNPDSLGSLPTKTSAMREQGKGKIKKKKKIERWRERKKVNE